jgi:hypothetical protein
MLYGGERRATSITQPLPSAGRTLVAAQAEMEGRISLG